MKADPNDLRRAADAHDVVGPDNNMHIEIAAKRASYIVAAWGALNLGAMSGPARERTRDVARLLRDRPLVCLGTTNDGNPRHPLMVAYATAPAEWIAP